MKNQFKKSAKKILSLMLAAALVCCLLPGIAAYAEEYVTISCNDQAPINFCDVTVGAGQTVMVEATRAAKYIMTINADDITVTYRDTEYVSENGEVVVFISSSGEYTNFEITNSASKEQDLKLKFTRFQGHKDMAVELERLDDVTIEQYAAYEYGLDTGTYLRWTAPSDGTVVLDVTQIESSFEGMKGSVSVTIGKAEQESVDGVLTQSVKAGDELKIRVLAVNQFNLPLDAKIYLKADFDGEQPAGEALATITPVPSNLTGGEGDAESQPTNPPASEPTDPPATETVTPSVPEDPSNPFTDVAEDRFYYAPVLWAVENDITNGTTATTFAPLANCTRGQVVTFLWRSQGSPEPKTTVNPFTDTKEDAYYYKAMLWAVENEITNGISTTQFAPDANCNRGQVATFLWRAVGSPQASNQSHPFTDIYADRFYYDAVLWAVETGVTNGLTATTFGPDAACNRGQIVTFLYRAVA